MTCVTAPVLTCDYDESDSLPETAEESVVSEEPAEVPLKVDVSAASVEPEINDLLYFQHLTHFIYFLPVVDPSVAASVLSSVVPSVLASVVVIISVVVSVVISVVVMIVVSLVDKSVVVSGSDEVVAESVAVVGRSEVATELLPPSEDPWDADDDSTLSVALSEASVESEPV